MLQSAASSAVCNAAVEQLAALQVQVLCWWVALLEVPPAAQVQVVPLTAAVVPRPPCERVVQQLNMDSKRCMVGGAAGTMNLWHFSRLSRSCCWGLCIKHIQQTVAGRVTGSPVCLAACRSLPHPAALLPWRLGC